MKTDIRKRITLQMATGDGAAETHCRPPTSGTIEANQTTKRGRFVIEPTTFR